MVLDTARNLLAGLKLTLLFPPVTLEEFRRSLSSSFLLLATGVTLLAVFSYTKQEGQVFFNDLGATLLGTSLFIATFGALLITRLQGSLDRLPDLLTLVSATFPWIVVATAAIGSIVTTANDSSLYWLLALIWCISIAIRAIRLTFPHASGSIYLGTAALIAVFAYGTAYRGHSLELFFSYDSTEYEQYASLDQEEVFLSQSRLLDTELSGIAPGNPDETEIYFIGFAGNGDESVFNSEARFVQSQIAAEFMTDGRSLLLASDIDYVDSQPLANTHNLFQGISHVGQRMNVDDDILFLFLTSHGSKDASIQVSLFPLQLKQLTAEDLRDALDLAQIQWRIVVVSACYSGSFIEPLMSEKTMIMTAAAAENTSFGCSEDRDLTYFGEAFFRDSFENGGTLLERFGQAKVAIEKREALEGRSPSDPQVFIGAKMEKKLIEIAASKRAPDHRQVARYGTLVRE